MNLFEPKIAQQAVRSEVQTLDDTTKVSIPWKVVEWCSYEVDRQHDPASYVINMVDAWRYALRVSQKGYEREIGHTKPSLLNILTLGYLVKPDMNVQGVRRFNVSVGWDQKLSWYQIPRALENLITEGFYYLNTTAYYREFEEIHPFGDGNGRVGSILYNWLNDTLHNPDYPPDVYDPSFWERKGEDTFEDS